MQCYNSISITSACPGVAECLSIHCDHILVLEQTAYLSFRKKAHLEPAEIRLAEATKLFQNKIAKTGSIESVVIDPNLSREPLAGRLAKVQTIHVSLLMELDPSEMLSTDSLPKQHWLGQVDTIASHCKKIFPQCDPNQSTFKLHTLNNQLYSCSDVFSQHGSDYSFSVTHEGSIT